MYLASEKKASYVCAIPLFVPAANATDMITISGSATKIIKIKRIVLSVTLTVAALGTVLLVKRSAANSGGTSSNQTIVPLDSTNDAATAVVKKYTANPSALGNPLGFIKHISTVFPSATSIIGGEGGASLIWNFGQEGQIKPITLQGVNENIAICNDGAALGLGYTIRMCELNWTEE